MISSIRFSGIKKEDFPIEKGSNHTVEPGVRVQREGRDEIMDVTEHHDTTGTSQTSSDTPHSRLYGFVNGKKEAWSGDNDTFKKV